MSEDEPNGPSWVGARRLRGLATTALTAVLIAWTPGAARAGASAPSHSAALVVPDIDETVAWYRDKLHFRPIADQSYVAGRVAVMDRKGFLLEIHEADVNGPTPMPAEPAGGDPKLVVIVNNVDEMVSRLRQKDVAVETEPEDDVEGRSRSSLIRDNNGQLVELREPLEPSETAATGRRG